VTYDERKSRLYYIYQREHKEPSLQTFYAAIFGRPVNRLLYEIAMTFHGLLPDPL
jgi:hypothetical protein